MQESRTTHVSKYRSEALAVSIKTLLELFGRCNLLEPTPDWMTMLSWFRGWGSLKYARRLHRYLPVIFHINDNEQLVWRVNIELKQSAGQRKRKNTRVTTGVGSISFVSRFNDERVLIHIRESGALSVFELHGHPDPNTLRTVLLAEFAK